MAACRSNRSRRWRSLQRTAAAIARQVRPLPRAIGARCGALFASLACRVVQVTGNLKLDVPAPPADPTKLSEMQNAIGERPVLAAASTHPGEEAAVIEAHRRSARHGSAAADRDRAAPSGTRHGILRSARSRSAHAAMLRSRSVTARSSHRHLCRRHDRRARPVLPARADRVHGRLAGRAWRTKSDRGGQARRGRSCMARMCGISPTSTRRSTPRAAPRRWTNTGHLALRVADLAAGPGGAQGGRRSGPAHRRDGWAARSNARWRSSSLI